MPILPDIPKAEAAIIEQTNVFRASSRLAPVKSEPGLVKAARDYARFLAASPIFSHEADGRRPIDRIKAAGYQPCTTAENLALLGHPDGFETIALATKLVEGWKGSEGHRKNMLLAPVTETGVAIAKARGQEKYFAVQLFGRPNSLQYTFQVENAAAREVRYVVGSEETRIAPRMIVRHTACLPAQLTFHLKPAGLLSKEVTARYDASGGTVYRLVASGRDVVVVVEVGTR